MPKHAHFHVPRICKGLDIPFETFVEDLFDGEEGNPGKEALLSGDEESS